MGRALAGELVARGCEVIVLTRRVSEQMGPVRQVEWDGRTLGECHKLIDGAGAVVNLAGRSVNCRHTPENRREILESRVNSTRAIGEAIAHCVQPPRVWVQASSLAIYGDTGERWCDESTPAGKDYLAETCVEWEKVLAKAPTPKTRRVAVRIGIVLAKDEGALTVLAKMVRWGFGGSAGNGKQYVSWLHIADMNRIFLAAIEREELEGAYNASALNPVTNAEFMCELRRALHRPWSPPAPGWAVRFGSRFLGTEARLALEGRRAIPKRLVESKFEFKFPYIRDALGSLY